MENITSCRVCRSSSIKPFFDLGQQPLANSLPPSPTEKEIFYPLALYFCADCGLVQLGYTVDPKVLFSNYVWVTGTSKAANDFAEKFYKELVARAEGGKGGKGGYVLEIASNDGTFLRPFIRDGYEVLGVDPAKNIADMAEMAGVPTKCLFFGIQAAREIVKEKGRAKMVFARNVLPHVANTHDFVDGLREALADGGVLAIETHYGRIILEKLHYDSIYHEHLCYFTLASLERLLADHGLYVFDIAPSLISGGGIVTYARKRKTGQAAAVSRYRSEEEKSGVNRLESWENFARRSFAHREKLLSILRAVNPSKLVGWGASARSSTMLNFCGIDSRILPAIIDLNPLKQGRYTAGTHIRIENAEAGMSRNPETVFILAWNFADEIINMLKNKHHFRGSYIIPLPNEPRVLK